MAETTTLTLGAAEAMAPALTGKSIGVVASGTITIACGFVPSRMSLIINGTADTMVEYISSMTGYMKITSAGGAAIDVTPIVAEATTGFTINAAELGAGDYYYCLWR